MTFTHILCPVDRSDVSRRAFDYAVSLARWSAARLTVLEVIDVTPPVPTGAIPDIGLVPDTLREGVREELGGLIAPALAEDVAAEVRVEEGPVAPRILDVAADQSVDLIVMGTHGRTGVQRLVLGSITEKIVRQARCPVLAIPPGDEHVPSPDTPFRTILCPTDFSEVSRVAVALASDLAEQAGARLMLMHVIDWPFGNTIGPDPVTALRESLLAQAERELTAQLRPARAGGPAPEVVAEVGQPARQISALALSRSANLIVMGVSGRGAVGLAVLGSTTHRVLREACCPVLTVRHDAAAAAAPTSPRTS